ncbi:MAG TPA: FAD-dependent oxidoreductase [Candidatus Udaeobacter sp.]|jgi:D-amino-acid oxidase|nr:FAD-dependent oxidoreductase [Candidatus Udaeobacter sp.]
MKNHVGIVGAGVSGLTCGVVLAESRFRTTIFAREIGRQTTSGAAAALWFPYDVEPKKKIIPWALETYRTLVDLASDPDTGVFMLELRQFSRNRDIQIPDWAIPLGARKLGAQTLTLHWPVHGSYGKRLDTARPLQAFQSGFSLKVPLTDTTIYLDYLISRFQKAGGTITENMCFEKLEDADPKFELVINCAGIGARDLVRDNNLKPHRGQVAVVPRIEALPYAVVCDDEPLVYAIPRTRDCVFGGTNDLSDDLAADSATTMRIVAECSRALNIERPDILDARVGLRPYRKSGVRLQRAKLRDGRTVIHNYGHGGSGFTLSWGCAQNLLKIMA